MEELELICFQLISMSGTAKSMYIQAIQEAKKRNFEKARELLEQGIKIYGNAHNIHTKLIQEEAKGNKAVVNLLLVHAEDQMMSCETLKIISEELIDLYTNN